MLLLGLGIQLEDRCCIIGCGMYPPVKDVRGSVVTQDDVVYGVASYYVEKHDYWFVTTCWEIWYTVDGTPTLPICRETCTKGMLQHYGLAAIPSLQALRPYTGCLTPYPCYPVLSPLVACSRSLRYGVHHLLADIWCQLFRVATPNSYTKTSHLSLTRYTTHSLYSYSMHIPLALPLDICISSWCVVLVCSCVWTLGSCVSSWSTWSKILCILVLRCWIA